jgi:hypothetical protein
MTRKEQLVLTAVWRNGGFSASYDSFVVGSSAVLRLNFCAKNPPLRQAAKRCYAIQAGNQVQRFFSAGSLNGVS